MSGYIGSKASVTQVDGYNRTEADAEFVQDPNGAITVSGSNVGIGTSSPTSELTIGADTPQIDLLKTSSLDVLANIRAETDSGTGGKLIFQTKRNGDSALDRMTIDDDGRVTTPYQPIVNCGISGLNTWATYAGSGISALYTTGHPSVVVQGGMIVSSDRVTVPVAGKYLVSARQLNQSNNGEYFNIRLNGTTVGHGYNGDTSSLHDMTVDAIVSCAANDYIQISYDTATTNRWGGAHSNLMIYLIG